MAVIALIIYGYFTSSLPAPFPAKGERPSPGGTPTPAAGNAPAPAAQVGRPFTFGGGLYSIDKIDRIGQLQKGSATLSAGGTFLLVFLSVENRGIEPLAFQSSDFALFDRQGRRYAAHIEATKLAGPAFQTSDLLGEAIGPGLKRQGVLAFDVPLDAGGFSFRLLNGYLDISLGS